MYDDRRAADFTEEVNAVGHEIWSRLGYLMQDSWALPAMVWRQRTNPLSSSEIFLTQADVISWRLAGTQVASDTSHTLKSGFDLDNGCWPEGVCEALGIPASGLNPVVEPGTVIGSVGVTAADDTGLPVGTSIVAGMTDGSAAQIAAGAVAPGSWNSVLGTTLVLKGSSATRQEDPTGAIYCHLAPFGSGWWPGGASNIGARAITEELSGADPHDLRVIPEKLKDTAVSYPLIGTGERFPFVSAEATGFTLGKDTTPTDPQGRFMEIALGVALIERLAFDAVEHAGYPVNGALSFTGGGSTNTTWSQLRASVLGREAHVPSYSEGSLGMAILARAGVEGRSREGFSQIVEQMVRLESTVTPDSTHHELLEQKYLLLIDELDRRGWIGTALAQFARENTR
jgi:sugar (pentulose or hexulose) kinase